MSGTSLAVRGGRGNPLGGWTRVLACHFVEVTWQPEIARLRGRRVVTSIDAGRILNSLAGRNQPDGRRFAATESPTVRLTRAVGPRPRAQVQPPDGRPPHGRPALPRPRQPVTPSNRYRRPPA